MIQQFGGRIYDSYNELLIDPSIKAVSVCTPNQYHAPISIAALNAGKHVLCEKPIATSVVQAEEMIQTAGKNKRFLMIGHSQRLVSAHIKAKEILMSREIGNILSFRTIFAHKGPESWSADKSKNTWFFKKQDAFMGAIGDLGDLGVHKADLIRW